MPYQLNMLTQLHVHNTGSACLERVVLKIACINESQHNLPHICVVQAVLELRKNRPFVSQNSGNIKAVAPEDLLPFLVGELRRYIHAHVVQHCCHVVTANDG